MDLERWLEVSSRGPFETEEEWHSNEANPSAISSPTQTPAWVSSQDPESRSVTSAESSTDDSDADDEEGDDSASDKNDANVFIDEASSLASSLEKDKKNRRPSRSHAKKERVENAFGPKNSLGMSTNFLAGLLWSELYKNDRKKRYRDFISCTLAYDDHEPGKPHFCNHSGKRQMVDVLGGYWPMPLMNGIVAGPRRAPSFVPELVDQEQTQVAGPSDFAKPCDPTIKDIQFKDSEVASCHSIQPLSSEIDHLIHTIQQAENNTTSSSSLPQTCSPFDGSPCTRDEMKRHILESLDYLLGNCAKLRHKKMLDVSKATALQHPTIISAAELSYFPLNVIQNAKARLSQLYPTLPKQIDKKGSKLEKETKSSEKESQKSKAYKEYLIHTPVYKLEQLPRRPDSKHKKISSPIVLEEAS